MMEGFMPSECDNTSMAEAEETKNVTVTLPRSMIDDIEGRLDYGDSMSGWIREATRARLARDGGDSAEEQPAD
jgi:Arc/MetJ-type ribon-helix-helix transcriptional regulator